MVEPSPSSPLPRDCKGRIAGTQRGITHGTEGDTLTTRAAEQETSAAISSALNDEPITAAFSSRNGRRDMYSEE